MSSKKSFSSSDSPLRASSPWTSAPHLSQSMPHPPPPCARPPSQPLLLLLLLLLLLPRRLRLLLLPTTTAFTIYCGEHILNTYDIERLPREHILYHSIVYHREKFVLGKIQFIHTILEHYHGNIYFGIVLASCAMAFTRRFLSALMLPWSCEKSSISLLIAAVQAVVVVVEEAVELRLLY